MNIVFIGPSGSGKDTQCKLLKEKYNYETISTGDLLREEIEQNTERGKLINSYLNQGLFVPDEIVYEILGEHIEIFAEKNLTLNGVIRSFNQIVLLDDLFKKVDQKVDHVIVFELSEETALERLQSRGRSDDEKEKILNRLREYKKDADKIIAEYEKRGIVLKIDAAKTISEIHSEISAKLKLD